MELSRIKSTTPNKLCVGIYIQKCFTKYPKDESLTHNFLYQPSKIVDTKFIAILNRQTTPVHFYQISLTLEPTGPTECFASISTIFAFRCSATMLLHWSHHSHYFICAKSISLSSNSSFYFRSR